MSHGLRLTKMGIEILFLPPLATTRCSMLLYRPLLIICNASSTLIKREHTYGWDMNPAIVVSSHIESANIILKEDSKVCHIIVTTYSHYELGIRTNVIVVKVNPLWTHLREILLSHQFLSHLTSSLVPLITFW